MKTETVATENAGELPSFGTLLTLASTFLPVVGTGLPRLVESPPVIPEEGSLEARARKAERRYQTLVEQIPVVTFLVSFQNRKSEIYVSPHVEKLLGYTAKEWVEDPILWYQRLYPADRSRWNTEFSRTIALAEPFKGDYRFLAKNGRIVWIHGEVTVARDESGRPSFLQGIGYEITELKLAEEVLRRSGEEMDRLVKVRTTEIMEVNKSLETEIAMRKGIEAAMAHNLKELADVKSALDEHAIVAITDPKGKIFYANDKFCAISKYKREELIGQDHRIINSGHHPKEFMQGLWDTITQGKVWKGEILNRAKDGTHYWVDTTIVPFLGEDGKPIQYVAIRADITERKRAQERQNELLGDLKEINEQLNQFAYVVSHDLKAPLRAISSLADWLITDYGDKVGEAGREQFSMLLGRTKRMNALVDGILRYSRITRQHEEKVTVDANQLLREACEILSPPPGIVVRVAPGLPVIQCERTRLTQVFENLISNAIKYMGKASGEINIGCERAGPYWKFHVRDTGPGIEEKYYEKIFQIFQTLAARDDRESTGIGLAIVKKNVELSGGRVWVESKIGEGSTFYFTIPIGSADKGGTAFFQRAGPLGHIRQENTINAEKSVIPNFPILLVEDDVVDVMSVKRALRELNSTSPLSVACNGEEALARLRNLEHALPGIILLDLNMPRMNGIDFLKILKTDQRLRRIPVVVLTTSKEKQDRMESFNLGAAGYMVKPLDYPGFVEVMRTIQSYWNLSEMPP